MEHFSILIVFVAITKDPTELMSSLPAAVKMDEAGITLQCGKPAGEAIKYISQ